MMVACRQNTRRCAYTIFVILLRSPLRHYTATAYIFSAAWQVNIRLSCHDIDYLTYRRGPRCTIATAASPSQSEATSARRNHDLPPQPAATTLPPARSPGAHAVGSCAAAARRSRAVSTALCLWRNGSQCGCSENKPGAPVTSSQGARDTNVRPPNRAWEGRARPAKLAASG